MFASSLFWLALGQFSRVAALPRVCLLHTPQATSCRVCYRQGMTYLSASYARAVTPLSRNPPRAIRQTRHREVRMKPPCALAREERELTSLYPSRPRAPTRLWAYLKRDKRHCQALLEKR